MFAKLEHVSAETANKTFLALVKKRVTIEVVVLSGRMYFSKKSILILVLHSSFVMRRPERMSHTSLLSTICQARSFHLANVTCRLLSLLTTAIKTSQFPKEGCSLSIRIGSSSCIASWPIVTNSSFGPLFVRSSFASRVFDIVGCFASRVFDIVGCLHESPHQKVGEGRCLQELCIEKFPRTKSATRGFQKSIVEFAMSQHMRKGYGSAILVQKFPFSSVPFSSL